MSHSQRNSPQAVAATCCCDFLDKPTDERWTIGFLVDVILTRDPFMHRVDISRATGVPIQVTPDHQGVLLDDVVREWGSRHAQPYRLELTGPADGTWKSGAGGEPISMDAVEFCRSLSGRASAGLLATRVPF